MAWGRWRRADRKSARGGGAAKFAAALALAAGLGAQAAAQAPTGPALIMALPSPCPVGECPPSGVFVEFALDPGPRTLGRVDYIVAGGSWSADVEVFCDLRGASEVVYSVEPPTRRADRVWIKATGGRELVGFTDARGRAVELPYADGGTEGAFAAAFAAPRREALPEAATPEALLWIARALWARACV